MRFLLISVCRTDFLFFWWTFDDEKESVLTSFDSVSLHVVLHIQGTLTYE